MRLTDHSVDVVTTNPMAMCYPSIVLPPTLPLLYPASLMYQPLPIFSDSLLNYKGVTSNALNDATVGMENGIKTVQTKCESTSSRTAPTSTTSQSNGKLLHQSDSKSSNDTTLKPSTSSLTSSPHLKKTDPVAQKTMEMSSETVASLSNESRSNLNVSNKCSTACTTLSALPTYNSSLSTTHHRINETFNSLPTNDLNASLLPFPFFSPYNLVSFGIPNNLETQTRVSNHSTTSPKMTSYSEDTRKPWASHDTIPFVYPPSSPPFLNESFPSIAKNDQHTIQPVYENRFSPLLQHEIKSLGTPTNAKRCRSRDQTDITVSIQSEFQHPVEPKPEGIVKCSPSICSSTNQTKRKRRDVVHKKSFRVDETQRGHEGIEPVPLFVKSETTEPIPSLEYEKTSVPSCTTTSSTLTSTNTGLKKDPSMCYRWRSDVLLTDERMSILPDTTTMTSLQEDTTKDLLSCCHISSIKNKKPFIDSTPKPNDSLGCTSANLLSSFEPFNLDSSFGGNPSISSCSQSTSFPCYDLLFSTTLQRIIEDTVFI